MQENQESAIAAEIIALERTALDKWYNGDPMRFYKLMAPSVTYFGSLDSKAVGWPTGYRGLYEAVCGPSLRRPI